MTLSRKYKYLFITNLKFEISTSSKRLFSNYYKTSSKICTVNSCKDHIKCPNPIFPGASSNGIRTIDLTTCYKHVLLIAERRFSSMSLSRSLNNTQTFRLSHKSHNDNSFSTLPGSSRRYHTEVTCDRSMTPQCHLSTDGDVSFGPLGGGEREVSNCAKGACYPVETSVETCGNESDTTV